MTTCLDQKQELWFAAFVGKARYTREVEPSPSRQRPFLDIPLPSAQDHPPGVLERFPS